MASAELTNTLLAASRGDQAATAALDGWKTQNYGNFCIGLAQAIISGPLETRPLAALFLKNLLHAEDFVMVRDKVQAWKTLDKAARQQVKELLLQALAVTQDRTAHFAALAASEVAAIELPHGEWPELVGSLMERVTTAATPDDVKLASLECLGFSAERVAALEEVPGLDQPALPTELVDRMLTTIVDGCQATKPNAMRVSALTALRNALAFCSKNMETKPERDFIFQAICTATSSATTDHAVVAVALECLDTAAQFYYDVLGDYMTVLFQLTTEILRSPERPGACKTKSIEFWNSICIHEIDLLTDESDAALQGVPVGRAACPKYVLSAMESYVPLLLELLTQQEDDIEDDMGNSPSATAAVGLDLVSQTVRDDIVRIVVPFVESNITSEHWRLRGAAILAFGCILEGVSTEAIGRYISQAVPILVQALGDTHIVVKDSATHTVSSICKFHISALDQAQIHSILDGLIKKLSEAQSQLASHAASAIYNIAQACRDYSEESTNVLSAPMRTLLTALLHTADRDDANEGNLKIGATSAIAELIMSGAMDNVPMFKEFLPVILDRMEVTLRRPELTPEDKEDKESSVAQFCGIVQMIFQRLSAGDGSAFADRAMTAIVQILQTPNATCLEDAFMVISAVASCLDAAFTKYLQHVLPSVIQGVLSAQAQELCTISVGVIVDICTAVTADILPFCDEIMKAVQTTLMNQHVARDIKPALISCFGDIAMAITSAFEPYVQVCAMMLMQASQQCTNVPDDEELLLFINNLRLAILEAYSGIIIGLADGNKLGLFMANVAPMFNFLQYLSTDDSSKDDRVLAKAVALVGDIVQQMVPINPALKTDLNQQWLAQLIQEAMVVPDDEAQQNANWTRGVVQAALSQP